MFRRWGILLLAFCLLACAHQGTVYAVKASAEGEEVTRIDLSASLGDDALHVLDVWMLNEALCVGYLRQPQTGAMELILLHAGDWSLLSRTPLPQASSLADRWWCDGKLCLLFRVEASDAGEADPSFMQVCVAQDGAVSMSAIQEEFMSMPGGQSAVRAVNGSLYAVDVGTGREELLLHGVPDAWTGREGAGYEAFLKYIPCADDIGYDGLDASGSPLGIPLPITEENYADNELWLWRDFHVYQPLDEHRFVYSVSGWEWGAGFGVYDLRTHADHRFTGRGYLYGLAGSALVGSEMMADTDTLEVTPLPQIVREQLERVSAFSDEVVSCGISPDGELLAVIESQPDNGDEKTLTLYDILTGDIIKVYELYEPMADHYDVSFRGNTDLMVFFNPQEQVPARVYLIRLAR